MKVSYKKLWILCAEKEITRAELRKQGFLLLPSDTSMECLFGMLPMCVLSGKQEALAELLDSEKNIKSEVQAELQRYVEE